MPDLSFLSANTPKDEALTKDKVRAEAPGLLDQTIAAFSQESVVGNFMMNEGLSGIDDGINPLELDTDGNPVWIPQDLAEEGYYSEFGEAKSLQDISIIARQLRREQRDRDILARSGASGIALQAFAGFADSAPLLFVAPASVARLGSSIQSVGLAARARHIERFGNAIGKLSRVADLGAGSTKSAIARAAGIGAIETGAQEFLLHRMQMLRTPEESALAVTFGAGIASGMTAAARPFIRSSASFDNVAKRYQEFGRKQDSGYNAYVAQQYTPKGEPVFTSDKATLAHLIGQLEELNLERSTLQKNSLTGLVDVNGVKVPISNTPRGKGSTYIVLSGDISDVVTKTGRVKIGPDNVTRVTSDFSEAAELSVPVKGSVLEVRTRDLARLDDGSISPDQVLSAKRTRLIQDIESLSDVSGTEKAIQSRLAEMTDEDLMGSWAFAHIDPASAGMSEIESLVGDFAHANRITAVRGDSFARDMVEEEIAERIARGGPDKFQKLIDQMDDDATDLVGDESISSLRDRIDSGSVKKATKIPMREGSDRIRVLEERILDLQSDINNLQSSVASTTGRLNDFGSDLADYAGQLEQIRRNVSQGDFKIQDPSIVKKLVPYGVVPLFTSPSKAIRKASNLLFKSPVLPDTGFVKADDAATAITFLKNRLAVMNKQVRAFYNANKPKNNSGAHLSFDEFSDQVGIAGLHIGNEQKYLARVDASKEAFEAAKVIKLEILDPLGVKMVQAGMMDFKEFADNPHYWTIQFDKNKLADITVAKEFKRRWVSSGLKQMEAEGKLDLIGDSIDDIRLRDDLKTPEQATKKLEADADRFLREIQQSNDAGIFSMASKFRRVTQKRVTHMEQEDLAPFVVNDYRATLANYIRAAGDAEISLRVGTVRHRAQYDSKRVELVKKIREAKSDRAAQAAFRKSEGETLISFGSKDLVDSTLKFRKHSDLVKKIREADSEKQAEALLIDSDLAMFREFNGVRFGDLRSSTLGISINEDWKGVIDNASPKNRKKLETRRDADLAKIDAYMLELRGLKDIAENSTALGRSLTVARQWTFNTLGGTIGLSSIVDASLFFLNGVASEVFGPVARQLVLGRKQLGGSLKEVKLASGVIDILNDNVNKTLHDLVSGTPGTTQKTAIEKISERGVDLTAFISGSTVWNKTVNAGAGLATQTKLIRIAEKFVKEGKLSKADAKRLGELGIDPGVDLPRIYRSFVNDGGGYTDEGVAFLNTENWSDRRAAFVVKNAVQKNVDNILIKGGVGEKPFSLFGIPLSQPVLKTLFFFRNYAFASQARVLARSVQLRDAQVLQGIGVGLGLGMLSVHLKRVARGKEELDFDQLMYSGIAASGIAGIMFDASDAIEAATAGKVGLGAAFGVVPHHRYYDSNASLRALLGPVGAQTLRLGSGLASIPESISEGRIKKKTANDIASLVWWNNAIGMSQLKDRVLEKFPKK